MTFELNDDIADPKPTMFKALEIIAKLKARTPPTSDFSIPFVGKLEVRVIEDADRPTRKFLEELIRRYQEA